MPSFGEGFAKGLQGSLEQRQQGMLQLQLLSKRMELEAQNRQQEMQQAHEYNLVPEQSYKPLAQAAGLNIPSGTGPLDQRLLESLFQGNSRALMAGVMQGRLNLETQKAQTSTQPVYDPQTGQQVGERQSNMAGGISTVHPLPDAGKKLEEGRELLSLEPIVNNLHQAANKIDFGRVGGIISRGEAALGLNPDVTNFNNLKTQVSTVMPKLLGNFNRFNDPEYNRLSQQASVISTPAELKDYLNNLDTLMYNKHVNLGIGADPNWKNPTRQLQESQDTSQHFNAGFQAGAQSASQAAKDSYLQSLNAQFGQANQNGKAQ